MTISHSQAQTPRTSRSAQSEARILAEQRVREAREAILERDQYSTRDIFSAYANSR